MGRVVLAMLAALVAVVGGGRTPTVHVTVGGKRCALSETTVPVGTVVFRVSNQGSSLDAFLVAGSRTRALRPGRSATLTVQFTKPGSYRYRCTAGRRGGRLVAGSSAPVAAPPAMPALTQLVSGLGPLTDVAVAPTDPNRVFAVQQDGKIVMVDGGTQQVVADFGADVRDDGENGMLDMTFSPAFAQDRTVYFYYISREGSGTDTLVAATMGDDWTVDMKSVRTVLEVATPGANHRGGDIAFAPDGYLYVPIGDGDNGTYTVIGQYAQDPSSMLGGILRVDVATGAVTQWAKGLRNPWRDYVDAATGLYYIGDVGENDQEEIDVVPLAGGPYNFGWPCVEGTEVHADTPVQCPDASQFTAPALTYTHEGRCAVIAGVVVHDQRLASLAGSYVYSDLCDGELRAFTYSNGTATDDRDLGLHVDKPTSFGEGPDGRIYLVTNGGALYRLDPAG
ncbi:MAG TPA: PQQ-dependent sugar dehydrogenase [Gaiellaceae bacterium]